MSVDWASGGTISLRGVAVMARHGVLPAEHRDPQPFLVDLDVGCDLEPAAASDDLADSICYAWLADAITGVVNGPPVQLVEVLAGRIADAVLTDERVEWVRVSVHKPQAPMPVAVRDVAVTVRRERCRQVVVALGSNLADRRGTLASALDDLRAIAGVRVRAVSELVETAPVGPPQPDYLNAVALLDTGRHPVTLMRDLHAIEARHGRRRGPDVIPHGPRTVDLDLIQIGDPSDGSDLHGRWGELVLPHPRAHQRAFVLAPWSALDPQAVLRCEGQPRAVSELLAGLPAVERRDVRPGPPW